MTSEYQALPPPHPDPLKTFQQTTKLIWLALALSLVSISLNLAYMLTFVETESRKTRGTNWIPNFRERSSVAQLGEKQISDRKVCLFNKIYLTDSDDVWLKVSETDINKN